MKFTEVEDVCMYVCESFEFFGSTIFRTRFEFFGSTIFYRFEFFGSTIFYHM